MEVINVDNTTLVLDDDVVFAAGRYIINNLSIGDVIKYFFLPKKGFTVTEFAQRCGSSRKHVNDVLRSKANITPKLAKKMSVVLGVDPIVLLTIQARTRLNELKDEIPSET